METVVFFLSDFIDDGMLKAAEKRFKNLDNTVCYYRKNNSKLGSAAISQKFHLLISDRDFDYLAWVFEQIDLVQDEVKAVWINKLIDIARYEIYEKHSEKLYVLWAAKFLRKKYPFSEIYFIGALESNNHRFDKQTIAGKPVYLPFRRKEKGVGLKYFFVKLIRIFLPTSSVAGKMGQSDVLFVENYPNSAKISLRLQKALSKNGIQSQILAINSKVWKVIKDIPESETLENSASKIIQLFAFCYEVFIYNTSPIFLWRLKVNNLVLKSLVDRSFVHQIARAAWYQVLFRSILRHKNPKLVLSTSLAALPVRAMLSASNQRNIASGFVQHGLQAPFSLSRKWILQKHFFIWGRYDRQILIDSGIDPNCIYLTGSNKIDSKGSEEPLEKKTGQRQEVLYLPQRTGGASITRYEGEELLEWFAFACAALPDKQGKVKFHPVDKYHANLDNHPSFEIVPANESVSEVLHSASVVVSGFSTTAGLEACAFRKPLIVLISPNRNSIIPYDKYGAALYARSKEELKEHILSIESDPALIKSLQEGCDRLLNDYYAFIGENSNKVFVEKVRDLIKDR